MTSNSGPGTVTPVVVRKIREEWRDGTVPILQHTEWAERFPWLIQGTTARGESDGFDLRLSGNAPVGASLARWRLLREEFGCRRIISAGQVHGTRILRHDADGAAGLLIAEAADGHATTCSDLLLAVSAADCIPVSIVDPERRAIAILHAGWRGVAARIIAEGVATLREISGSTPADLYLHLGPAICGDCYEVGSEVHTALGLEPPGGNTPIDLRAIASRQALDLGIPKSKMTISAYCTRCQDSPFFSHRAGSPLRQVGVLGIRRGEEKRRDHAR